MIVVYASPMLRSPDSHKGENGKVAVIGGSRSIHGAPLFSALAAEAAGADLLYLFVPPAHEDVAKNASLNFQVRTFLRDEFGPEDVAPVLQLLASMDCAVIGPGLAREKPALEALRRLITGAPCPLVLDASALQPDILPFLKDKIAVLTPHLGELERMGLCAQDLGRIAAEHTVTILLKGATDRIAGPDGAVRESAGGNAGLTVGGTGDALAGLVAGLIAQRMAPPDAALLASRVLKSAGERLFLAQGYSFTARDVIGQIPFVLHDSALSRSA